MRGALEFEPSSKCVKGHNLSLHPSRSTDNVLKKVNMRRKSEKGSNICTGFFFIGQARKIYVHLLHISLVPTGFVVERCAANSTLASQSDGPGSIPAGENIVCVLLIYVPV